jgi:hypothetical protein
MFMETLRFRKSFFPTARPDVKMPEAERLTQSPMKARTAQRMRAIESIHLQEVWTAQQMQATESTRLQWDLEADAMAADSGSTLCNRLDTRVASSNAFRCLLEVLVANPDAVYASPSLNKIMIFETYLKRFIGYIILRIP